MSQAQGISCVTGYCSVPGFTVIHRTKNDIMSKDRLWLFPMWQMYAEVTNATSHVGKGHHWSCEVLSTGTRRKGQVLFLCVAVSGGSEIAVSKICFGCKTALVKGILQMKLTGEMRAGKGMRKVWKVLLNGLAWIGVRWCQGNEQNVTKGSVFQMVDCKVVHSDYTDSIMCLMYK